MFPFLLSAGSIRGHSLLTEISLFGYPFRDTIEYYKRQMCNGLLHSKWLPCMISNPLQPGKYLPNNEHAYIPLWITTCYGPFNNIINNELKTYSHPLFLIKSRWFRPRCLFRLLRQKNCYVLVRPQDQDLGQGCCQFRRHNRVAFIFRVDKWSSSSNLESPMGRPWVRSNNRKLFFRPPSHNLGRTRKERR